MSSIAWAEFLCGPVEKNDIALAGRIVPDRQSFTDEDAEAAARLFNISGRRRGTFIDCMIAAVAFGGSKLSDCKSLQCERFVSVDGAEGCE